MRGLSLAEAAARLSGLYDDLDHAHGFYEGNSRTLREFTRELTLAAGFNLQWGHTNTGAAERDALYIARDVALLDRAFPGLTPDRGMATDDRAEYEKSVALERLRRQMGERSLQAIIRERLTLRGTPQQPSVDANVADRDRSGVDQKGQGSGGAAPGPDATNRPTRGRRRR